MRRPRAWLLLVLAVVGAAVAFRVVPVFLGERADATTLLLSGNIEAHESVVAFKAVQSRIVELPFEGRTAIEAFLRRKWDREHDEGSSRASVFPDGSRTVAEIATPQ